MKSVITGGAGFIGSNLTAHKLSKGDRVVVFDSLARSGSKANITWLKGLGGDLEIVEADIRDFASVRRAISGADTVYHLAGQVAVTTSVLDPRSDFEVNALGTFNVLEAVRLEAPSAFVAYSSTNKVYGGLLDLDVHLDGSRYFLADLPNGVNETRPLDFHSPYGCSKGAADQYVRDYSRIYGLKTVVFRQGCVYGSRQFGNEDQGWVAHFMIQALKGRKITVYGDGFQVRDILHVEDLISCLMLAEARIDDVSGGVFNVGGGPANTLSLRELIAYLRSVGNEVAFELNDWRAGDQRVYVSDISKAAELLGWEPSIGVEVGLLKLREWIEGHLDEIA